MIEMFSETEIIAGCIKKNVLHQRILYDKYVGKLMTVCRRYTNNQMEAEDMLQEGFIKIFTNISTYKNEGSFEGWLRKVVINNGLRMMDNKKIKFTEPETATELKTEDANAFNHLCEEELLKLINELPEGCKVVFNLYAIEGYKHEEIGELLNIHASSSRSQLTKARRILQQKIEELQKIAV